MALSQHLRYIVVMEHLFCQLCILSQQKVNLITIYATPGPCFELCMPQSTPFLIDAQIYIFPIGILQTWFRNNNSISLSQIICPNKDVGIGHRIHWEDRLDYSKFLIIIYPNLKCNNVSPTRLIKRAWLCAFQEFHRSMCINDLTPVQILCNFAIQCSNNKQLPFPTWNSQQSIELLSMKSEIISTDWSGCRLFPDRSYPKCLWPVQLFGLMCNISENVLVFTDLFSQFSLISHGTMSRREQWPEPFPKLVNCITLLEWIGCNW